MGSDIKSNFHTVSFAAPRGLATTFKSDLKETFFPDDPFKQFKKEKPLGRVKKAFQYFIPIFEWLPKYSLRMFQFDLLAGISPSLALPTFLKELASPNSKTFLLSSASVSSRSHVSIMHASCMHINPTRACWTSCYIRSFFSLNMCVIRVIAETINKVHCLLPKPLTKLHLQRLSPHCTFT